MTTAEHALDLVRDATRGTAYDGRLWLVGGWVRDKALGEPPRQDIDIVLESDAGDLAHVICDAGIADHAPVTYPRFGTAMVTVAGQRIELVTARRESYDEWSRKPAAVEPATLAEDASRRDFTINTLIENLHGGQIVDPLGLAYPDLNARIIRTPIDPEATFRDDPLRMLRAVRFSARLGFEIEPATWRAIVASAERLAPPTVSAERIRDEFIKTLETSRPAEGVAMLAESGLLAQFAPELLEMRGCEQNEFHSLPVWEHVLLALTNLVNAEPDASVNLRLAVLLHDIGKPRTRSVGGDGRVHFYGHEDVGARMARTLLGRLKLPGADIEAVASLVAQHMRIGEYKPERWTDAAVRRFVRGAETHLDDLFAIHRADVRALSASHQDLTRARLLKERIELLETTQPSRQIVSPLTGDEIMALLGEPPGPRIGVVKDWLTGEVIEGRLTQGDKDGASALVRSGRWKVAVA
ncbi:MAG: HD domain-containing protein [Capsulimonadaceae bacterium]|nr:HD domain-containing protein [Capsulimonadaceae bacterium]